MNPKYKGRQQNRIITQFPLMQAGILSVEQVNNKINFKKTLQMRLNYQRKDHWVKATRNTNIENTKGVRKSKETARHKHNERALDQSYTKLRSKQPISRRQRIVPLTQTNPKNQTTPYPNQNQGSILSVDLMGIITNPFSVPKGMQYQQIAGEAAQVHHALRETFSTNGNVRRVASSTDRIASGQVGVAGTKPTNIQTAPSTQLQGNPVREPKVKKKGGRTPVRSKTINTNNFVVANQNQSEDQQR
ncbi:MAG: hypothetical protein EZS28_010014 [Streblomastix strix]|uniref:Uncharacterized protein n=1 Tax=Streblomastix strix TaxID=222440 RepID=A0A5J4WHS4_9EUKA|nr:MAG: hypothetical protein EZS28_010014 [Streblomastix strix]